MLNMGQLTHLPPSLARNPFHPLLMKFSRYKFGSYEELFTLERWLLRYSWAALLLLFALVLPPLEQYWGISTVVRLSTLVYPCFLLWSLTRLAGVELMQLLLEGHWTPETLALPLDNRAWMDGFVTPVWVVLRQYFLITVFSLALYGLETRVFTVDRHFYWSDYLQYAGFIIVMFFNAVAWIVFMYLARLYTEIRIRNGLIKGLATLLLFCGGGVIFCGYLGLFLHFAFWLASRRVIFGIGLIDLGLLAFSWFTHGKLLAHFRDYLASQLDIDILIYDDLDAHASAWTEAKG